MDTKLKSHENSVWEKTFNSLFEKRKKSEVEMFIYLSELIMHRQLKDNNLSKVYKTLGMENFLDLVTVLQGQTIKIPSLEEVRDNYSLAVIYYYREILGWEWKEIKESEVVDLSPAILEKQSSISYGLKVNQLSSDIREIINNVLIDYSEEFHG